MKPARTKSPPTDAQWVEAAELLKVLAHPQRLKMIRFLTTGRQRVGDIAEHCGLAQAVTSNHLRLLVRCGLLSSERDGHFAFYSVADPSLLAIMACLDSRL